MVSVLDDYELIIDLHLRNDRQGPGGDDETSRAIALARLGPLQPLRVADIGCGTGASSLVLAETLGAHVTAVDAAQPFIDRLAERASERGLGERITPVSARMEALPFGVGQFDAIWSEGAIYNMGFGEGLRAWRPFLRTGGVVAVSELTWTTPTRPHAIDAHWTGQYPGIRTAPENLRRMEESGYEPMAMFFLPRSCWETGYYAPLVAGFSAFLKRHANSDAAQRIVAAEESEIALYRDHGEWYGYAFYVGRARANGDA